MPLGGGWAFECETFAHQPRGHSLQLQVAGAAARLQHVFDQVARDDAVPPAEMALGEPHGVTGVGVAQAQIGEPGDRLLKIRNPSVEPAGLDLPVAPYCLCHCGIERKGPELERLVTEFYALLRIAAVNVHGAGAPQSHYLDAQVVKRVAVVENTAAIIKA